MTDVPPPPPPPPPSFGAPPPGGNLDIGAAVSYAWNKFQANAGQLIAIVLVIVLVNIVGFVLGLMVDSFFMRTLLQLVFFVVGQLVTIGIINAALMITRGEQPEIGTVFKTDKLVPFILATLLFGVAVIVGFILCVLPGIAALFLFGFYGFYVIDQGMAPVESLNASFNMVSKHIGSVFLLLLVAFAINFLGLAVCFVGTLVAAPMCWIILAYGYRSLNGQQIAP